MPGEAMQKRQLKTPGYPRRRHGLGGFKKRFGEGAVKHVVAQIADDRHELQPRDTAGHSQRGFVEREVQRQRRAVAALLQRVGLDNVIWQHGQLVAGHVNRRQARPAHRINGAAGQYRQARRCDVNAQRHGAVTALAYKAVNRQRIVDLGRAGVINRKRPHRSQRQFILDRRRLQGRESRALGKVFKQKPLPVKLIRRGDGADFLQQIKRCCVRGARRLHHGLVFRAVLVGPEQNFVKLLANRRWALAAGELVCPGGDLRRDLLFLFDGIERQLQNLYRRFFEAALARAAKVMRCFKQPKQGRRLLLNRRRLRSVRAEVIARHLGKAELVITGEFPGQVQFNFGAQSLA